MSELAPSWVRLAPNWSNLGLLRSVKVNVGSRSQNIFKLISKSPRFVPYRANLAKFRANTDNSGDVNRRKFAINQMAVGWSSKELKHSSKPQATSNNQL